MAKCWKDILGYLKPSFQSVAVMEKIKSQPSSNGGKESVLKCYIRGLDATKLGRFLCFVSGSEILLFPELQITFSH